MNTETVMTEAYRADMRWVRQHSAELRERYENQWIAVVDQKVVAAGPDLGEIEDAAARETGRKAEDIYVEFLESRFAIYGQDFAPF